MKKIENIKTKISEDKIRYKGNKDKLLSYKDLIEVVLDIIPQGGFTPKDIRERNRIQESLDSINYLPQDIDENGVPCIYLEDSDFEALEKIVEDSRWTTRHKDLDEFLRKFREGDYKK